jgi:hypothetical protein
MKRTISNKPVERTVKQRVLSLLGPFFDADERLMLALDPNHLEDDLALDNLEGGIGTKVLPSDTSIAVLIARLEASPPPQPEDQVVVTLDLTEQLSAASATEASTTTAKPKPAKRKVPKKPARRT